MRFDRQLSESLLQSGMVELSTQARPSLTFFLIDGSCSRSVCIAFRMLLSSITIVFVFVSHFLQSHRLR